MILNYLSVVVCSMLDIRKSHRIEKLKTCFIATSFNFHFECKHKFFFEGKRVKMTLFKIQNFKGSKPLYLLISVRFV